eukprot:scaffold22589_cov138-Cylindrotheca_fusiformis.AAC.44
MRTQKCDARHASAPGANLCHISSVANVCIPFFKGDASGHCGLSRVLHRPVARNKKVPRFCWVWVWAHNGTHHHNRIRCESTMAFKRSCCTFFLQLVALLLSLTRSTFGRATPFVTRSIPHRIALADEHLDRFPLTTRNTAAVFPVLSVRGGDLELASDHEDGIVLEKTRNFVRSILEISDKNVPFASKLLRSCLSTVESLTGIRLLPVKKLKKSSKSSKKSKKSSKTDEEEEETEEKAGQLKQKNVLKKPSTATKKHLATTIKSTNPNYRIQRELKEFVKSPPPNLSVQVGTNLRVWVVTMVGANNTIYEGEVFKLRIKFPPQYPTVPPSVYFLKGHIPTHEHVYTNGDICLSLLGKDWRPTMTAQSIAVSILSILSSAQSKSLPMDNARHAGSKPGEYQKDWVYHDDNC